VKGLCEFAEYGGSASNPGNRDAQLSRNVQAPDRLAFRELVDKLQSRVFSVSYALLGDPQEADEAAQSVFVTIYRKARWIDKDGDYLKWVYQLAIDQCFSALRTRRLRKSFRWLVGNRSNTTQLTDLTGRNRQGPLLRALALIPDKERALLVLREVADQPVEDIAEIMHMDSQAVRRQLFVARRRLQASLSSAAEK
jgi:RNA polymerase sigma-70 factor (ECF subfamily)